MMKGKKNKICADICQTWDSTVIFVQFRLLNIFLFLCQVLCHIHGICKPKEANENSPWIYTEAW